MHAPALQAHLGKWHACPAIVEIMPALQRGSAMLLTTVVAVFTSNNAPIYLPGAPFLVSILLMRVGLAVFIRDDPTEV